jgi:hypothetical protein
VEAVGALGVLRLKLAEAVRTSLGVSCGMERAFRVSDKHAADELIGVVLELWSMPMPLGNLITVQSTDD